MILKLYDLLFILALPIIILRLLIKSIKLPAYRSRIVERLGIMSYTLYSPKQGKYIWIHAVSVGEIMASIPIIQRLLTCLPDNPIMLTCTTPRGSEVIQQKLGKLVEHVYLPMDFSFSINNFLTKINPKVLILIEKEIWPNIISCCNKHKIPIIIANAQLSNHSLVRFLKFKWFFSQILGKISYILAQTKFDAYKFMQLLAPAQHPNIIINGNTKFDILSTNIIPPNYTPLNSMITRPIWIAASTHAGEERIVLKSQQQILGSVPDAILILVPRHPERCKAIIKDLLAQQISFITYSTQPDIKLLDPKITVYLVDVIGQLNNLYQLSQIAFIGGSLIPGIGGHNVLEAAALALPIAIGSYNENCKSVVAKLKQLQGITIINNAEELADTVINWLLDPAARKLIGNNAKNYLIQQQGSSNKIVDLIQSVAKAK